MVVNYESYNEDKMAFFKKHDNDFICETSPMDEYGHYWKTYTFADNAIWYEAMVPVTEETIIVVHECKCKVEVKFLRTEFWSTESGSKYYYEQW